MPRTQEGSVNIGFSLPEDIRTWVVDRLIGMGCTYASGASWSQFFRDWHNGKIKVYREVDTDNP